MLNHTITLDASQQEEPPNNESDAGRCFCLEGALLFYCTGLLYVCYTSDSVCGQ